MKPIKILSGFLVIFFSVSINATTNIVLKNYFEKTFLEEKVKFLECVEQEGLPDNNQLYSSCEITDKLSDAAFILYDIKSISAINLLDHIKKYRPIRKEPAMYPSEMLKKSEMGYVILKFDISKSGKTINHTILEGLCGNIFNPLTVFQACEDFNNSALRAAKKLLYEPSRANGLPIETKDVKHRFTFLMAEKETIHIDKGVNAYKKLIKAINKNDFDNALMIANKNIKNDSLFLYQKAITEFYMNDFEKSIETFQNFLDRILEENKDIDERYFVMSFSMQVAALFNLGRYQEVINLEQSYKGYLFERKKYRELLSITNFYIGASFANVGNFHRAAYYIALADNASSSKTQSDYFKTVVSQISSYL